MLHGSFVLSNAVLKLTTGFLQVSLELLVLLLQFTYSLSALLPATSLILPLAQRAWKKWTIVNLLRPLLHSLIKIMNVCYMDLNEKFSQCRAY